MNQQVIVQLNPSQEQHQRLIALQSMFAAACNHLASVVQETRCWNRVALHHMTYKQLRQRFPDLGSQMACNSIYSACRAARLVYQHPKSPFNISRKSREPLPLLHFAENAPVWFDRHTLNLKDGNASMFTLDGRIRFQLNLKPQDVLRFHEERLREIVLARPATRFVLAFHFDSSNPAGPDDAAGESLPDYLHVSRAVAIAPIAARRID